MTTTFSSFQAQAVKYRLIPVVKRMFADTTTPIQLFQRLSEEAICLLESNDRSSEWARFSFVGIGKAYELMEKNNSFSLINNNREKLLQAEDLESAFQKTFGLLRPSPGEESMVPFPGGAVGVIPYDAIRHQEKTLNHGQTDMEPVHFVFCETIVAFDHDQSTITIIHYRDCESEEPDAAYEAGIQEVERLIARMQSSEGDVHFPNELPEQLPPDFTKVSSNYERATFLADVEKIKDYILQGDVFQTVISQRFQRELKTSAFMIYRVLRRLNPSPYMFFLRLNGKEIVGSSPERLVEVKDNYVEIHPIAGTRKRGATEDEDKALAEEMLASPKERAEHQMLVDLARNDVGRVAQYGSVHLPTFMEVGRFSHVMHIVSKVRGKIRSDVHPLSALHAGFPAGTVSGAPKVRAMEILKELEPTNRGIYAGGVGYMAYNGHIDSCIAIRTMVIENEQVSVQSGAGIVADSIPEEEYEETLNKAAALFSAIETAEAMVGRERGTA